MAEDTKLKFFYGYIIVVASFFILALTWGTFNTFGVFLTPMATEFGWTRAMTSGPRSLCTLLMGLASIFAGSLNDRFGPRLVMTICGFSLGLGYLLMSQINDVWHFYLFYGVMIGIGMGGPDISLLSTLARWFVKKRGMMSGIIQTGAGAGMLVMPLLANWLISNHGWRTSCVILGFVALVFTISAAQFLRRDPSQMGPQADGDKVKKKSPSLESNGLSLKQAIHTRQFWLLCGMFFLFVLCVNTVLVHIYPHVTDIGVSETIATNTLAVIGGASIAGRFIMGSAGDIFGNKLAVIIDLSILAIASLWLNIAEEVWMLYVFAALYGFACGGLFTLISPMIAELFGMGSHGTIFGTIYFLGAIGGTVGPVVAGHIFDITGTYQLDFIILTFASIIATLLVAIIKNQKY